MIASVGPDLAAAGERIRRLNHDGLAGLIYGPGFPVGASPILAGLGPTIVLGLPAAGLPGVFHADEQGGQLRPVGVRRSERKRGQVAGELVLSILAGVPPCDQPVPLVTDPKPQSVTPEMAIPVTHPSVPVTPVAEPKPVIQIPATPEVTLAPPLSIPEPVAPELVLEPAVVEEPEVAPIQAEAAEPPGESPAVEDKAGDVGPPQTP